MSDLTSLTLKQALETAQKDGAQPILKAFSERAMLLNPKINAFLRFNGNHKIGDTHFSSKMSVPVVVFLFTVSRFRSKTISASKAGK